MRADTEVVDTEAKVRADTEAATEVETADMEAVTEVETADTEVMEIADMEATREIPDMAETADTVVMEIPDTEVVMADTEEAEMNTEVDTEDGKRRLCIPRIFI